MKLGAQDPKLLESVERGEWKAAAGGERERTRFSRTPRQRSARIVG